MKYYLFMAMMLVLIFNVCSKVNYMYEHTENKTSTNSVIMQYIYEQRK